MTAQQVRAIENTSTGNLTFTLYSHLKFQYLKKTKYLPEDSHEGINSAFFLQMFHQYHLAERTDLIFLKTLTTGCHERNLLHPNFFDAKKVKL